MGSGANRILNIMKYSGKNTISHRAFVTVNSLNPLTFKLDDKLILTTQFYILSDDILLERLKVGQKLVAFSFNDGQCYFIHQSVDNSIIKTKIIDNLNDNSTIDSLSARQGKLLGERVLGLEEELIVVKNRLTNAENRLTNAENRINTVEYTLDNLESRVSTLENWMGGF